MKHIVKAFKLDEKHTLLLDISDVDNSTARIMKYELDSVNVGEAWNFLLFPMRNIRYEEPTNMPIYAEQYEQYVDGKSYSYSLFIEDHSVPFNVTFDNDFDIPKNIID